MDVYIKKNCLSIFYAIQVVGRVCVRILFYAAITFDVAVKCHFIACQEALG